MVPGQPAGREGPARGGSRRSPSAPAARFAPGACRYRNIGQNGVWGGLVAAMSGVSGVVLVSPAMPAQELNVVASAASADAGHVVKATSKAAADSPIARRRWQAEIEAGLAASGIPHTLLRSNAYMQNVLPLAPAIAATSSFGSAAGNGRAGMIDARDVAAVAATIAAAPAPHAGKTHWLTGPELLSNYDGAPEPSAQQNAQAFSLTADGDAAWVTDDVRAILGRPARSFEQFAADHAAAFS